MPRSIWKGSIAFGLVNIPVSLSSAESRPDIQLHMVDSKNHARIRYERVNAESGEEVPWDRMVRGYEYEEGQFILLTDKELEAVQPKLTKTIEITEFVSLDDIDPLLFDKPYYLEPDKRGRKAYSLLREALRKTGKAGISKVVIRTREYLSAMFVRDDAMVLMLLRFPQEIRAISKLELPSSKDKEWQPVKRELDLALRLIQEMTGKWKPDEHHDEYRKALIDYVEKKAAQGDIADDVSTGDDDEETGSPKGKVVDLAEYLERSMKSAGGSKAKPKPASKAKPPTNAAARKTTRKHASKDTTKKRAAALDKYRHKRDFKRTPEPGPTKAKTSGRSFVVQEHHARSHHYDFRLEMNGVLVSWAVPKGPPEDFVAKRLAVHVEDHPLEYGKFAGEIPKGNYGAGTVAIWDNGEWEPLERNWRKAFDGGKLKFILRGEKLQGTYLLARMKEEPNWIFRKLDDETHLPGEPVELEKETAAFVTPQLARVVPTVPEGKDWVHEIKLDGYRLIAVQRRGNLRLFTRNELDWTDRFADLAKQLKKVSKKDFVLDGEAVVFDAKGRSSFGGLQAALQSSDGKDIDFVAFDLLHLDGLNLRALPLSERLARLEKLVPDEFGRVRHSKIWPAAEGKDLFKQACKSGLEGIISKTASARYAEGSRRDWTKSKCRARQEFIICGYTPPKNSCPAFGALVLGSLENGKIVPRGKVGTGFSEDMRRSLLKQLAPLQTAKAPFEFSERHVTWVKPERVVEIEFAEITRDGSIRQGSFIGIREDKAAKEVHLDPIAFVNPGAKEMKVAGMTISHPERLVFPADQVTKLEVATYYETVGELMLPHVANRPMAVLRAPSGITGQTFFQKSFPTHLPDRVFTKELPDGTSIFYVKTVKGLVSLAQFGVIEFHPWGAPLPTATKPDVLVWDLDPDEAVPWNEVLGAAFLIRDFLAGHGLETRLKTSGGKGLHIMLHLKKNHDWETMRTFSKAVATAVAEMNPKRFTVTSSKAKRTGKIYIDWLRNGEGSTCVAPWSLRARPGAAISRPIDWEDLSAATAAGFTIREPVKEPKDWKKITPQMISKALLKELGVV